MIDQFLPVLRSNCSRIDSLDIFIHPDVMIQAARGLADFHVWLVGGSQAGTRKSSPH
jgi:hypothetical protein